MTDSPADTLRAAAARLREHTSIGAYTATTSGAALLRAREPLADWLDEVAQLHEPDTNARGYGCDWCGDEDWPCSDTRHALAVARAVLGDAR